MMLVTQRMSSKNSQSIVSAVLQGAQVECGGRWEPTRVHASHLSTFGEKELL
jgi:hypothetical protein